MHYSSAIKRNELLIYITTWMDLKISTLNERRQTKKRVHTEWFHIYTMYKPRPRKLSYSDEKKSLPWLPGAMGGFGEGQEGKITQKA